MRGVDPLLAEVGGRFAQSLPGFVEVRREIARQRRFRRRPAVVRVAPGDPLFAVVALPLIHAVILALPHNRAMSVPL